MCAPLYIPIFLQNIKCPLQDTSKLSATMPKVSAAKDKCRISRHRVEVDQIAINLDTTIVDTTINPLLLPSIPATLLARS